MRFDDVKHLKRTWTPEHSPKWKYSPTRQLCLSYEAACTDDPPSPISSTGNGRGVMIHLLHRWIDLYSYDPTTSICARQVGLPGDIYRLKIVWNGKESILLILGNCTLDLSTANFKDVCFFSTFNDKDMLNVTRFSLSVCDVISTCRQQCES